ncbi:MerR family transcriptional regulator [Paracraurococcus lichenis]|uniref:Helix-turn-helix domain-containing protein n=1 Tax=Paracraurococcus lichenis TaxID=3064888 RepID=A0ABT9E7N5_9PROT|nr:helix-turn-helix domain-containing protein [Paracraurococcus sp. LOR1-02]MDO9712217.1 helix-turn-helix domain-containing protein [Paracraurococcus sp. LOR1-02]
MVLNSPIGIGALARATGAKLETIRWYERVGMLPAPDRTSGNFRSYGKVHLDRLSFIRRARGLGFSLDDVRQLLRLADQGQDTCIEREQVARAYLAEIERRVADLEALKRELHGFVEADSQGAPTPCRILQALSARQEAA